MYSYPVIGTQTVKLQSPESYAFNYPGWGSSHTTTEPHGTLLVESLFSLPMPRIALFFLCTSTLFSTLMPSVSSGCCNPPSAQLSMTVLTQCQICLPLSLDHKFSFPEGNLIGPADQVPPVDLATQSQGTRSGKEMGQETRVSLGRFLQKVLQAGREPKERSSLSPLCGCLSSGCEFTSLHNLGICGLVL